VVVLALTALAAALVLAVLVGQDAGSRSVRPGPVDLSPADTSSRVVLGGNAHGDASVTQAQTVGEEFLRTYLAFVYGRAEAAELRGATAEVRHALRRSRVRVPPARAERRPTIARVEAVWQASAVVQVTATVDDGDIAPYAVTAFVERRAGRWLVTHLAED
jgi:hypothetical protein